MMDKQCDLLLDYFNGHLTNQQKAAFESHLKDCPSCQEELKELEELTMDLPYASEPIAVPDGMKQRILSNVKDDSQIENKATFDQTDSEPGPKRPIKPKRTWFKPFMAAALTLSLVGNGAALYYINEQKDDADTGESFSVDSMKEAYTLQASEDIEAAATAMMIEQNRETNLIIQANNLPELKGDEKYQVWVLEEGKPFRAGTFVTNQDGKGGVSYTLHDMKERNYDTIAITKEPNANSQQPQGDILLSSPL
ncbi:anti-sigma factor [Virgibacillus salexigens]|uniref:Anti-sigma-W factor RsiW n=1 Tax=Virgibacillus kapii TaxID=1638645 RepID=A0ABQ2DPE5_9BACI|nr:anti-sigma factor [Virgibacillus kapii]GGJ66267.1 hypothetical protein GCM10007111_30300 [Virgibacillus kapii]